jgi:hypothetical protein
MSTCRVSASACLADKLHAWLAAVSAVRGPELHSNEAVLCTCRAVPSQGPSHGTLMPAMLCPSYPSRAGWLRRYTACAQAPCQHGCSVGPLQLGQQAMQQQLLHCRAPHSGRATHCSSQIHHPSLQIPHTANRYALLCGLQPPYVPVPFLNPPPVHWR